MKSRLLPLHLFQGYGIELEYMLVDRETLDVRPLSDLVLKAVAGDYVSETAVSELAWSNELVLHVIELKTNGPAETLNGLARLFHEHILRINRILEPSGVRLMPTATHPWMNPRRETKLWPHEFNPVYKAYDRIFGCRGHGWANLQSMHLNLPFANDVEFGRLHAAIRLLLPIMPALAASSPLIEGRLTKFMDNRMNVYRGNTAKIPSITGDLIPEQVFTTEDYQNEILQPMFQDICPFDQEGTLQHEWLNSRGAIPRFDRNAFEIRVLDIQESPIADLAIAWAISRVLQETVAERWIDFETQKTWSAVQLKKIFYGAIRDAESLIITNRRYLQAYGFPSTGQCSAGDLWAHLIASLPDSPERREFILPLTTILQQGTLSRRIIKALGNNFSAERLRDTYRRLCDTLDEGGIFQGE